MDEEGKCRKGKKNLEDWGREKKRKKLTESIDLSEIWCYEAHNQLAPCWMSDRCENVMFDRWILLICVP